VDGHTDMFSLSHTLLAECLMDSIKVPDCGKRLSEDMAKPNDDADGT
jgi:hypothetical protein